MNNGQEEAFPQMIQSDDGEYFPIFTNPNDMDDHFIKVKMTVLKVIELALDYRTEGIVLNPLSEPFVLEPQLYDVVENMKSRIRKEHK